MMHERDADDGGDERPSPTLSLPLSKAWAAAAIVVPTIVVTALPLQAVDLAYSVRVGDEMLRAGSVSTVDTLTLPAHGLEWLNAQWGAQVLLASVFRAGGWFGLSLLRTLLILATTGLVYLSCRRNVSSREAGALTLLGSAFFLGGAALRPQLFGLACFALVLWLTSFRHTHPRVLLLVIPVTALWANLHGSFVLGPAWVALAALRDAAGGRDRAVRTFITALVAAAAALVNPFGPRVFTYVVDLSSDPLIRRFIQEWRRPTLDPAQGVYFAISVLFLASVVAVVWYIARAGRHPRWPALVTAVVVAAPAALSLRGVYWWGMAAPVLLAEVTVPRERARSAEPRGRHVAVVVGVFGLGLLAMVARWAPFTAQDPPPYSMLTYAPPNITRELRGVLAPGEPIFNAQLWGSWFEFALPNHPVFADSRIEVIPSAAWADYLAVSDARPGWQAILERWNIRVIAARDDQQGPLISALDGDAAWTEVYRGDGGAVFVRGETAIVQPGLQSNIETETRPEAVAARTAPTRVPTPSFE
ncbi:MAG TPA: hypothetical protein VFZ96_09645 [Actinomycetota bacterium]|nr:hypothetical protein [Actinomycetota bacterium]